MRRKYLFTLLFLLSLVLATCKTMPPEPPTEAPGNDTSVTIWWNRSYFPEEDEALEQVVREWERSQTEPGNEGELDAELSFYSADDIVKRTIRAIEEGNPPDILFFENAESTLSPRWAWDGNLAEVKDVLKPVKDLYSTTALESIYFYNNAAKKRAYYAVPIQQQTIHIHYWRDLLNAAGYSEEDIPKEWDAFWEFWKKAQDALRESGQQEVYGIGLSMSAEANDTFEEFEQVLEAYDVQLLDENGQLLVDDPKVRRRLITTLEWFTSFYKDGYVPPGAVNWVNADNNINFLNRTMLMTLNPTLSIPSSQREDKEIYHNQMVTIEFPDEPDGEKPKYLVAVKQALIFASSKNKKGAKDFLSYLVQPEHLGPYLKGTAGRYYPVMPLLWKDPFWHDPADPHVSVAAKQLSQGQTRPFYSVLNPAYSQVQSENIWGQAIERVVVDGWSSEKAADEAIERIKQIFTQWAE
ncbi:MAG: ABC transporter substrate-binding protein [Xenococcaceae cyanobacterium]